ncbi:hypothetical protein QTP70_003573 [Hemibagrus guttatus]|uniref:Gypsy retrotransposon integrase-like protein 1 n=1 Tax=Hemibagrus guttatus TaxID=175788 RepID=A0AAE0VET7_9TELE|nr:hypothetical protein QTP70_003573 [Hemibagrus guttatus]
MGRGSPISPVLRRKIVEQYQKGVSQRKIAKSLKLSSSTVHNIIQRFRESRTISVRKGQGRKTILDARDLRALRRHCITYRNATEMEITTWAQEYFQKTLLVNTIHRAIRCCRLKLYRSKKKPYLNMIQKRRRFLWAKAHLKWTVAEWKTVLWSDESKFEVPFGKLGRHVIRTKEDKDNPSCYQRSVQKPASLMWVWNYTTHDPQHVMCFTHQSHLCLVMPCKQVWEVDPQIHSSFTYFTGMIWEVFEYPAGGEDISLQLMELRQGSDSGADYAIKFHTLAAQSGWNEATLWAVFHEGLNPALQTELACREDATSLMQFVATAICLDNLLRQHQAGARPPVSAHPRVHPDYPSSVAGPLTSLLKEKPRRLAWTNRAQAAFQQLKDCFTTAPILRHPDPDLPFVVEVDASSSCIGAVLSQRHGKPGKLHPYSTGGVAALAGGGASPVPGPHLEYLRGAKWLNPRQARWALFFTRFQFSVTYRPGSKNCKADALSRQFEVSSEPVEPDLILSAAAILAPVQWSLMEEIRRAHINEPPPAGCHATKVFVPLQFRRQVMQLVHEAPSSGHPGIRRSIQLTCCRFCWPSLGTDVERYVQACPTCAQSQASRQLPEGLLEPFLTPQRPWSHLSVDFLTDLSDTGGFATDIVSDRAPQFSSRVWGALCAQLGIGVSLSSGYHPQSNGQVERLNQEIGRFLRSYCSREQQHWSEFLPWAEYAQNSLTHSSTGLTPFQCMLGYQPPLFPWSGEPSNVPAVEEWSHLSQEGWEQAHVHLQRERVWLSTRNLRLKLPCRKLSPKFVRPFEIIRHVNPVSYRLQLPASYRICPTVHVSLLKPVHPPGIGETDCVEPPPPLDIEGSPAYQVHALLDSRRVRSRIQYLVDWEGYGPEEHLWVDMADILDPSLSEDFHRDHPNKPAPRPRECPRRRTPGGVPRGRGSVTPHPRSGHEREPSPIF